MRNITKITKKCRLIWVIESRRRTKININGKFKMTTNGSETARDDGVIDVHTIPDILRSFAIFDERLMSPAILPNDSLRLVKKTMEPLNAKVIMISSRQ